MITGATGFVGYHTAMAMLDAGHEVSLLVRSVDKMLNLFGEGRIEHYTRGSITDADKVRQALEGCDAVIHAAAMVSTGAADAERVFRTNVEGARTVLGTALDIGIERIIHVSSVTALFDPAAEVLDENSPPGAAQNAYGRSKVECERFVRELQDRGHPVHITYPATVIGPDDPGLTEAHVGMLGYLKAFVPIMPTGNQYVDVRDVAEIHRRLLELRLPPGRYPVGGHYVAWRDLGGLLESVTGRRLLRLPLLGSFMRATGRLCDRISNYVPLDVPVTEEAMGYATNWVPMDNGRVERELDFRFRPVELTMADTVTWLNRAGHISEREAGLLAEAA
jgi:nucleoside-diphosphate-sugar epimerase